MKEVLLFLSMIFMATLPYSCCSEGKKPSVEHQPNEIAIALNNEAVELMGDAILYRNGNERDSVLNRVVQILDDAIAVDSLYIGAYSNKVEILLGLGRTYEALTVQKRILEIKEFPEARFMLGMMQEWMGDMLSARKNYQKALIAYDELLVAEPESYSLLINKYSVLLFLQDKEKTLAQMKEAIRDIPVPAENTIATDLEYFDKKEVLSQIFDKKLY